MKNILKRYVAGGVALLMLFGAVGCGKKEDTVVDSEDAKYATAEYPIETDVVL